MQFPPGYDKKKIYRDAPSPITYRAGKFRQICISNCLKAAFGQYFVLIPFGVRIHSFLTPTRRNPALSKSQAGDVVREYVAPQLPQPEYRAGILFEQSQCLCPVSFPALCRIVNQNADAGPFRAAARNRTNRWLRSFPPLCRRSSTAVVRIGKYQPAVFG